MLRLLATKLLKQTETFPLMSNMVLSPKLVLSDFFSLPESEMTADIQD